MISLKKVVLASRSPRRIQMFKDLGIPFDIIPADIDETMLPGEMPDEFALRMAGEKAMTVATRLEQEGKRPWIVSADTVVVIGDSILAKPRDNEHAQSMLRRLSGKTHSVITGWTVGRLGKKWVADSEQTRVTFHDLTDVQIDRYVDTGESLDKAGAYALQGIGTFLVKGIVGDYFNVVGLPISKVTRVLLDFGVTPEFLRS